MAEEWTPVEVPAVQKGVPGSEPVPRVQELPEWHPGATLLLSDAVPVPGRHYVEWEGQTWIVKRKAHLTESQYVDMECEETRRHIVFFDIQDAFLTEKGSYVEGDLSERLAKTMEYARWRYRGYLAGQVWSL